MFKESKLTLLAVVVGWFFGLLCGSGVCRAENTNWDGSTAEWDELFGWPLTSHWSNGIPDGSTTARINTGTAQIHNPRSDLRADALYLGYLTGGDGAVTQTAGGRRLTVDNDLIIGQASSTSCSYLITYGELKVENDINVAHGTGAVGSFTQNGPNDPSVVVSGDLNVGHRATGTYTLNAANGNLTVGGHIRIGDSSDATGTFNLQAGTVTVSEVGGWNNLYVGESGEGTLSQTGGEITVDEHVYVGYGSDSSGTYQLEDGDLSVGGYMRVGDMSSSTGIVNQSGGTNTITEGLVLGHMFLGSEGTYNLSGDGQLSADGETIGSFGTGTFTQSGGTNTVTGGLTLGSDSGSAGSYTLSGTGQLSAHTQTVGAYGTGTFQQSGGTNTVTGEDADLFLGLLGGGSGTYILTGGTLSVGDDMFVGFGNGATGELEMSGGALTVKRLWLGFESALRGRTRFPRAP